MKLTARELGAWAAAVAHLLNADLEPVLPPAVATALAGTARHPA